MQNHLHPARSRDDPDSDSTHTYDLTLAIYGALPSHTLITRSRAPSRPSNRQNTNCPHTKSPPRQKSQLYTSIHQSTCLNLSAAATNTTEADLWILPDFDDWDAELDLDFDLEGKDGEGRGRSGESDWASLLRRAARSNLERLRKTLEGEGFVFVRRQHQNILHNDSYMTEGEGSIDEEFDVVVVPTIRTRC